MSDDAQAGRAGRLAGPGRLARRRGRRGWRPGRGLTRSIAQGRRASHRPRTALPPRPRPAWAPRSAPASGRRRALRAGRIAGARAAAGLGSHRHGRRGDTGDHQGQEALASRAVRSRPRTTAGGHGRSRPASRARSAMGEAPHREVAAPTPTNGCRSVTATGGAPRLGHRFLEMSVSWAELIVLTRVLSCEYSVELVIESACRRARAPPKRAANTSIHAAHRAYASLRRTSRPNTEAQKAAAREGEQLACERPRSTGDRAPGHDRPRGSAEPGREEVQQQHRGEVSLTSVNVPRVRPLEPEAPSCRTAHPTG